MLFLFSAGVAVPSFFAVGIAIAVGIPRYIRR